MQNTNKPSGNLQAAIQCTSYERRRVRCRDVPCDDARMRQHVYVQTRRVVVRHADPTAGIGLGKAIHRFNCPGCLAHPTRAVPSRPSTARTPCSLITAPFIGQQASSKAAFSRPRSASCSSKLNSVAWSLSDGRDVKKPTERLPAWPCPAARLGPPRRHIQCEGHHASLARVSLLRRDS